MKPYDAKECIKIVAICQAMEKQNPKKPERVYLEERDDIIYLCPNHCVPYYEVFENMNYCPNCGQKLDWGEKKMKSALESEEFVKLVMEKQKPKKPKRDKQYKYGRRCPVCNHYLGNVQFIRECQQYCENCGQKINWQDTINENSSCDVLENYVWVYDEHEVIEGK